MATIESLQQDIESIKKRNEKVSVDKAWEMSLTRRLLLIIFTYSAVGFYLWAIEVENPWLNAIVPSLGFLLSTLTLPFFKKIWKERMDKNS